jgi:hypothetical protein
VKTPGLLPPPCGYCAPNDGAWRRTESGQLTRCNCARGLELARRAAYRDRLRQAKLKRAAARARAQHQARRRRARPGWRPPFDGKQAATGDES